MRTKTKAMCRGEVVARLWHALRSHPEGISLSSLYCLALQHDHDPQAILERVLGQGKVLLTRRRKRRWLTRGPRWEPGSPPERV